MKKLLGLCLVLTLLSSTALAQVTTVDGVGADKDSAVRDAMRNAVEQVIGTFIDSRTLVDKSVVALDEIYAKSQGYVKNLKILQEWPEKGGYRVTAQIDVDTNPNSQLIDRLSMLMVLNDPRIAVVAEYYGDSNGRLREKYPAICEASMNNKLLELGFNHVVDSSVVKDERGKVKLRNMDTDYMVFCKLDITTQGISLPSYSDITKPSETTTINTGLVKTLAELDAKVMKTDTQEVIGQFRVEANGMEGNANNTENQAVKQLGTKAAESLRKIFAMKAANIANNVKVIVRARDDGDLVVLEKAIKELPGVENAFIRAFSNGKGVIEVEGSLKPVQIFKALREKMSIFMENTADNTLEISI